MFLSIWKNILCDLEKDGLPFKQIYVEMHIKGGRWIGATKNIFAIVLQMLWVQENLSSFEDEVREF